MKKLAYFCWIFVAIFAINACESDSRHPDTSDATYDELSIDQLILPNAKNGVKCSNETAWAGCNFFNGGFNNRTRGNWALYTKYLGSESTIDDVKVIPLVAGQNLWVGRVTLEPNNGGVLISICLDPGWCLQQEEEPIKIQDYTNAPTGNPAPGHFQYKGPAELVNGCYEMQVPLNNFYAIHVLVGCCQ